MIIFYHGTCGVIANVFLSIKTEKLNGVLFQEVYCVIVYTYQ